MLIKKAYIAEPTTLAQLRQVEVICSTGDVDRAGEVVVQAGIDLSAYRSNPIVLWQHDPAQPIARAASIGIATGALRATVQFPEAGVSVKSDEIFGLIGAGVVNGVSIGFDPTEMEPIDPRNPRGPQKFVRCALLEFSFVSVPANPGAMVVGKTHKRSAETVPVGNSFRPATSSRAVPGRKYVET